MPDAHSPRYQTAHALGAALGQNNNPTILVSLNDGTVHYNPDTDGDGTAQGSCVRHIRNPTSPTHVKITYLDGTITVRA